MVILSCKKTDSPTYNVGEIDKPKAVSNFEQLSPVLANEILTLEAFAGYSFSTTLVPSNEFDAQTMVAPLMYNAKQFLYSTGLTSTDLMNEFGSLDDYRIAYVAFAMQVLDIETQGGNIPGCNSNNLIVKCLVSSLLPCSIFDLFTGGLRDKLTEYGFMVAYNALPYSAKRQILQLISARSVRFFGGGALGLAFFLYDFTSCMVNGGSVVNPNDGDILEGTMQRYDIEDPNEPLAFPANYSQQVFYTRYYTHIGAYSGTSSSYVPMPATNIYFNVLDLRYYRDTAFTKVLPNGYYLTYDDLNNNLTHKFREVFDGKVIFVGSIADVDQYRPLETFDPASHLPFFN